MSVAGLCEICEQRGVDHDCNRCGTLVCDRHFDDDLGVCVQCAVQFGDRNPGSVDPDHLPDDVDTYEF